VIEGEVVDTIHDRDASGGIVRRTDPARRRRCAFGGVARMDPGRSLRSGPPRTRPPRFPFVPRRDALWSRPPRPRSGTLPAVG
jgi:hypothetical protein